MCRLEQWPKSVTASLEGIAQPVFSKMFGPYFFNCTGNIRDYNRIDDLHQIKIPVLIVHGEHDYAIPEIACMARDNLPHAELAMLQGCSHMPFYEKPNLYTQKILAFLSKYHSINTLAPQNPHMAVGE